MIFYETDQFRKAFRGLPADDELRRILMTPREGHLFDDGTVFTNPRALQGVPLERITEDSEYWEPSWKSLGAYIAGETHQENEKRRWKDKVDALKGTETKEYRDKVRERAKLHSDNVSKQRKIRVEFSNQYHPNQVVSKEYLPAEGLCEQEIAYKLACKISDLQVLRNKGELAMDPFDFIRWRISKKILEKDIWKRSSAHNPIRSIITKLGDDGPIGSGKHYEDPLFRAAILRSARYQDTEAKYGAKKSKGDQNTRNGSARNDGGGHGPVRTKRRGPRAQSPTATQTAPSETRRERKLAKLAAMSTGYSGTSRK